MAKVTETLYKENARIGFKNFSGVKGEFNRNGDRQFALFFDDLDEAQMYKDMGWDVYFKKPKSDPDAEEYGVIYVTVRFDVVPPNVYKVCNGNAVQLNEHTVGQLDKDQIINVDLELSPYNGKHRDGTPKVTAYLKTMYATIAPNRFSDKYAHLNYVSDED